MTAQETIQLKITALQIAQSINPRELLTTATTIFEWVTAVPEIEVIIPPSTEIALVV